MAHRFTKLAYTGLLPTWRRIRRSRFGEPASQWARRATGERRTPPAITDDLQAWCATHDIPVIPVSGPLEHRRTPPVALGTVHPNFDARRTAIVPQRFLVRLDGSRVWGPKGLVVLPDGSFASQSIYDRTHLVADRYFLRRLPARPPSVTGDVLLMTGGYSSAHNWFHWIHEGALRLHGVLEQLPDGTRLLVPTDLPRWKAETLRLMGIPGDRLLHSDGRDGAVYERLWFSSMPSTTSHHPDAVHWLRERLLAAAGVVACRPRRRVFLSRTDADHARIVNEAELIPILEARGFEIVLAGSMPVTDQIRYFAEASHIVGPTGAAFTNLLFASPTTRILEILEPRWAQRKAFVIWTWAETVGQPFSYVMADTVDDPENPDRANLHVDPAQLAATLDAWLDDGD